MATENKEKTFDADFEILRISKFLKSQLDSSSAKGYVLGMSGGIDSAVVACLCHKAVGPEKLHCLRLFEDYYVGSQDYEDAGEIISMLKVKSTDVSITPIFDAYEKILKPILSNPSRVTLGNLKARIRMTLLYAFANHENYLVAGTGDRSEDLLGFFSKYGDGGVDVLPIAHLYKGQVREVGRRLGLPEKIVTKPSSPNLWEGHKATDEIPADYAVLDPLLFLLFDRSLGPLETAKHSGVPISLVDEVIKRNLESRHKRSYPPMVSAW